jgi:uncharacterized membrane protein YhaH (DUF805 family)
MRRVEDLKKRNSIIVLFLFVIVSYVHTVLVQSVVCMNMYCVVCKHGEVFPKKASPGVWGSPPQPPEAGFFGRFRRNRNRQSISINFPKRATKP